MPYDEYTTRMYGIRLEEGHWDAAFYPPAVRARCVTALDQAGIPLTDDERDVLMGIARREDMSASERLILEDRLKGPILVAALVEHRLGVTPASMTLAGSLLDVLEDVDGNVCIGVEAIPRFPWGWTETSLGYPDALEHLTQEDLMDMLLEALGDLLGYLPVGCAPEEHVLRMDA